MKFSKSGRRYLRSRLDAYRAGVVYGVERSPVLREVGAEVHVFAYRGGVAAEVMWMDAKKKWHRDGVRRRHLTSPMWMDIYGSYDASSLAESVKEIRDEQLKSLILSTPTAFCKHEKEMAA